MTRISVVGSAATVRRGLEILFDATDADELMLTGQIFDHAARLRSFRIVSQVHETMAAERLDNYEECGPTDPEPPDAQLHGA